MGFARFKMLEIIHVNYYGYLQETVQFPNLEYQKWINAAILDGEREARYCALTKVVLRNSRIGASLL